MKDGRVPLIQRPTAGRIGQTMVSKPHTNGRHNDRLFLVLRVDGPLAGDTGQEIGQRSGSSRRYCFVFSSFLLVRRHAGRSRNPQPIDMGRFRAFQRNGFRRRRSIANAQFIDHRHLEFVGRILALRDTDKGINVAFGWILILQLIIGTFRPLLQQEIHDGNGGGYDSQSDTDGRKERRQRHTTGTGTGTDRNWCSIIIIIMRGTTTTGTRQMYCTLWTRVSYYYILSPPAVLDLVFVPVTRATAASPSSSLLSRSYTRSWVFSCFFQYCTATCHTPRRPGRQNFSLLQYPLGRCVHVAPSINAR